MSSLSSRIAKGASWMIALRLFDRGVGLVSTVILARILVPTDFGLIAMAMSVIAMLEVLGSFGFETALIQNQAAERMHYDTAWTFNVVFYVSCGGALLFLASPVAGFYGEPRLVGVLAVLALGTAVQGFNNIGVVAFQKELQFHREFKLAVLRRLAAFGITTALALIFRSYWALAIGQVCSKFIGMALTYAMHPYRPRFTIAARRDLFKVSRWLLVNNILGFVGSRASDFVIGKVSGAHSLGVWTLAYEFGTLPTTELSAPVNRVIFPGYAQLSANIERLRDGMIRVYGVMAIVAIPAGVGLAVVSEPLTAVILGSKWGDVTPVMQVVAILGVIAALQSNWGFVYLAMGRPLVLTWMTIYGLCVGLPLLALGVWKLGPIGAAYSGLATAVLSLPVHYYVANRLIGLRIRQILAPVARPMIASIAMAGVVSYVDASIDGQSGLALFGQLLGEVTLGMICYSVVLIGLWALSGRPNGAETELMERVAPSLADRILSRR